MDTNRIVNVLSIDIIMIRYHIGLDFVRGCHDISTRVTGNICEGNAGDSGLALDRL